MELSRYDGDMSRVDFLSLLVVDIAGQIRSVSLPRSYATGKILEKGIGFDASNFGYAQVNKGDMVAVPDLGSAFVEKKDGLVILHAFCDVMTGDGEPFDQYPRTIAARAAGRLRESGFGDEAMMLVELEFYAFDEVRYSTTIGHSYYFVESAEGIGQDSEDGPRFGPSRGYHRIAPEDRYGLLRNRAVLAMEAAGIPVKYHHHEVGASQLEIELDFMGLAKAADAVVLSRWIIKSTADELGLFVTFMPKPMSGMAGSGMHVHQFVEKGGASIFPGDGLYGLSREGLSYAAGLLSHALSGSLLAWSNPSTNSYRRLVTGFGAPVSATIARASKAAAIRVPAYLRKDEARIEFRSGDATANAYYFLAAMLLAGLDGLERGLDPVKMGFNGTRETAKNTLPTGLFHVLSGLKRDSAWLAPTFPSALVESWIESKKKEAEYISNAPVPQEYELYF